ncbi:MAG TPA: FlgD immunoglobulin-like domain containing protein [Candidatus Cloacimonadota bacterium]|nr:FlgD immunoglobulin-like domain containing protein [Candidatus Cloacimonadota bacterium]
MRTHKYLLMVVLWITIVVSLVAQNGSPHIIGINQLAITGSDIYCFIIINESAFLRIGYPNQIVKINLITKQTDWTINTNLPCNMDNQLIKTPDNNICYADGGLIVKMSTDSDTLWTQNLTNHGNFALSASSPDFLACYSASSNLVLLDYDTGQIIDQWSIITGGLVSCAYHNVHAAADSTFYLFDNMPMGVLYNTGIKITKIKIINGIAEIIWFLRIDDLATIQGIVDDNIIYAITRQIDPWNNSLIYRIIDQGDSYTLASIIDIAGPDSVGIVGFSMAVDNNHHHLILPVAIRLGNDPNGEDGYSGAIMGYNNNNLVWRINQTIMPFCLTQVVAINSNKIYGISMCMTSHYGVRTFWLTELETTVATDDPTTPAIPEPELTCYPNPCRGSANVKIKQQTGNSPTTIAIYNTRGQLIRTLVNGQNLTPGKEHTFTWDGTTGSGQPAAAGIYFFKIKSGHYSATRKMILMK